MDADGDIVDLNIDLGVMDAVDSRIYRALKRAKGPRASHLRRKLRVIVDQDSDHSRAAELDVKVAKKHAGRNFNSPLDEIGVAATIDRIGASIECRVQGLRVVGPTVCLRSRKRVAENLALAGGSPRRDESDGEAQKFAA
jgi:hypothetical protein